MLTYQTSHQGGYADGLEQMKVYIGKLFRIFLTEKEWKVFPISGIVSLLVSLVCVNVFKNMEGTQIGALAFACVCIWNGLFNSIQSVCRERAIIKREHRSGLRISSYIGSHMVYQAFLCAVQTIIQIVVYLIFSALTPRTFFFPSYGIITGSFMLDFAITLFLISYASDMCALMISCMVKDTTTAMTLLPFVLIVQLLFSGVAFELSGNMETISNFTIGKWGIRTICTICNYNSLPSMTLQAAMNSLQTVPEIADFVKALQHTSIMTMINKEATIQAMDSAYAFTNANVWKEWGVLFLMALLFALIGMIALSQVDRDKR